MLSHRKVASFGQPRSDVRCCSIGPFASSPNLPELNNQQHRSTLSEPQRMLAQGVKIGESMRSDSSAAEQARLTPLRELSARIGGDPLLTQASTGNTSIKLGNVLWIKASGRWLADAKHDDILVPLQLSEVKQYIHRQVDPSEVYAGASIETAMHAVVPHPVVLHVHSVNTIAWAVRQDARYQLERRLKGLRWQWIPYVPSGLP